MKKLLTFLFLSFGVLCSVNAQQTIINYLSGTDKDHTVAWDFYCTKGQNSGKWTRIAVPSNWELQGFGGYTYGNGYNNNITGRSDEQGLYKYTFSVSPIRNNHSIFIVFEGVMTDTEVKINGQLAGPIHQGGFYQFRYDITELVKNTESNLLEVKVSKESANPSVNKAERKGDFWALGGIFRPVYLQMLKPEKPKGADNDYTSPPSPAGNLGIMCAIPPIGTKFQAPEKMGPQSQKNIQLNDAPYSGVLWFEF